jgi:hypothetical protein
VVQNTCKPALIYLQLPSATSCPVLPVVSEWYQKATGAASTPLSNERTIYTLTVPGVRGDASSLDRHSHWIPSMGSHAAEGMDETLD